MRTPTTLSLLSSLTKQVLSMVQICQTFPPRCFPEPSIFYRRKRYYYVISTQSYVFSDIMQQNCTLSYNPDYFRRTGNPLLRLFFKLLDLLFLEFLMPFNNMICPSHCPRDEVWLSPVFSAGGAKRRQPSLISTKKHRFQGNSYQSWPQGTSSSAEPPDSLCHPLHTQKHSSY